MLVIKGLSFEDGKAGGSQGWGRETGMLGGRGALVEGPLGMDQHGAMEGAGWGLHLSLRPSSLKSFSGKPFLTHQVRG